MSSDAVEILSVSFLLPSATCDLNLSSEDKGWLNAIVFVGKCPWQGLLQVSFLSQEKFCPDKHVCCDKMRLLS